MKIIVAAIAVLTMVIMSFAVVGPAAASNRYWAHGADVRISIFDADLDPVWNQAYPANTPFYIAHGWLDGPWSQFPDAVKDAYMGPTSYFELWIDGALQHSSKIAKCLGDSDVKSVLFVSEYDLGMTGTHTFEGRWYLDGYLTGGTPGEAVLMADYISIVTFI